MPLTTFMTLNQSDGPCVQIGIDTWSTPIFTCRTKTQYNTTWRWCGQTPGSASTTGLPSNSLLSHACELVNYCGPDIKKRHLVTWVARLRKRNELDDNPGNNRAESLMFSFCCRSRTCGIIQFNSQSRIGTRRGARACSASFLSFVFFLLSRQVSFFVFFYGRSCERADETFKGAFRIQITVSAGISASHVGL